MRTCSTLKEAIDHSIHLLRGYGALVEPGHWQGTDVRDKPDMQPFELMDVAWRAPLPGGLEHEGFEGILDRLAEQIKPNLPWADDHFEERVGRLPTNPGDQYMNWSHWRGGHLDEVGKFTHTYQERIWPRRAGWTEDQVLEAWKHEGQHGGRPTVSNFGIHYRYGDLDDVVELLLREPYTRQAYLPIFFPEDTGAHHGGRIPCTLGYHFMMRQSKLHCWYTIRSCDAIRHFRDDVYLAARLQLWVLNELRRKVVEHDEGIAADEHADDSEIYGPFWHDVKPGSLTFHAYSFHCFKGDLHALQS